MWVCPLFESKKNQEINGWYLINKKKLNFFYWEQNLFNSSIRYGFGALTFAYKKMILVDFIFLRNTCRLICYGFSK